MSKQSSSLKWVRKYLDTITCFVVSVSCMIGGNWFAALGFLLAAVMDYLHRARSDQWEALFNDINKEKEKWYLKYVEERDKNKFKTNADKEDKAI